MAAIIDVDLTMLGDGGNFRCVISHQGRSVVLYCGAVPLSAIASSAAILLSLERGPTEVLRLLHGGSYLEPGRLLEADLIAELLILAPALVAPAAVAGLLAT